MIRGSCSATRPGWPTGPSQLRAYDLIEPAAGCSAHGMCPVPSITTRRAAGGPVPPHRGTSRRRVPDCSARSPGTGHPTSPRRTPVAIGDCARDVSVPARSGRVAGGRSGGDWRGGGSAWRWARSAAPIPTAPGAAAPLPAPGRRAGRTGRPPVVRPPATTQYRRTLPGTCAAAARRWRAPRHPATARPAARRARCNWPAQCSWPAQCNCPALAAERVRRDHPRCGTWRRGARRAGSPPGPGPRRPSSAAAATRPAAAGT